MLNNQVLFEQIFKQPFTDTGNKALLEQVAEQHPYFAPAQFYLLQQTGIDNAQQASKTALLFNNPYWLNFQLKQTELQAPVVYKEEIREEMVTAEKTVEAVMPQEEEEINEEAAANDTDNDIITEKEIEPMKLELKLDSDAGSKAAGTLLFEPMHLVDYFASQGIKLSNDIPATDKLGTQLKSFTDWLKVMKKKHDNKLPAPDAETEVAVQALAERSNTENEVLTESMAEVFAKQGKNDKAVEVYQKLSLLDPSKIAYFAAKIDQIGRE